MQVPYTFVSVRRRNHQFGFVVFLRASSSAVVEPSFVSKFAMCALRAAIYCFAGCGRVCSRDPKDGVARSRPESTVPTTDSWPTEGEAEELYSMFAFSDERSPRKREGREEGIEERPKRSGELLLETSHGSTYWESKKVNRGCWARVTSNQPD